MLAMQVMTRTNAHIACSVLNNAILAKEMVYKPFEDAAFADFFLAELEGVAKVNLLCGEYGFVSGCTPTSGEKAYITMIVVAPDKRGQGIGKGMIQALEKELLAINKEIKQFEIIFFNPMNLVWQVPGTEGHEHPNAPGIDVSCKGYVFFKNMGFRDFAMQNSYYILLSNYELPEKMQQKQAQLAEKGVTIEVFDAAKHTGMLELLQDLDSPLWTKEITAEIARPDGGRPILVPVKDGVVAGFTGPLERQPSGRGYFAGIGVHSEFRGYGVAKVLFSSLCEGLKKLNADYMTLFTGEINPARNIYEAAGFRIVRTWANMCKEVK